MLPGKNVRITEASKECQRVMWQCPRCGRQFPQQNHEHPCAGPSGAIEEYIAAQPENVRPFLLQVLDTLRAALPGAQEKIAWGMPTFRDRINIIHFAAHKNHMGLYPGSEAIEHFANSLKAYQTSKGAIRFPYGQPPDLDLIARIARWCRETGNHH